MEIVFPQTSFAHTYSTDPHNPCRTSSRFIPFHLVLASVNHCFLKAPGRALVPEKLNPGFGIESPRHWRSLPYDVKTWGCLGQHHLVVAQAQAPGAHDVPVPSLRRQRGKGRRSEGFGLERIKWKSLIDVTLTSARSIMLGLKSTYDFSICSETYSVHLLL